MRAGQFWRGRRIAPVHEGPRNETNNKAHEPTSGHSTHYGSGRPTEFSTTLGTCLHRYPSRCLVALPSHRDLLLWAKHLFAAAMVAEPRPGA